ncbi:MAG: hypothetical protein ACR2O6_12485, partial [Ilumatobacteraceae bacterium]
MSGHGDADTTTLFPSEHDVPRRRRTVDVVWLIVSGLAFALLGWAASGEPETDTRVSELLAELPSWIRTLAWFGYTASAIAALLLLVAAVVSRQERRLVVRDLLVAVGVAVILAILAARTATGAWPFLLPEFVDRPERL